MNKTADILFIITLGIIIIPLLPILMPYWLIKKCFHLLILESYINENSKL